MSAIVGAAGLVPGLRALSRGATLALANKESLVTAGPLMLACAARHGGRILPVDSEHSAVFQALAGEDIAAVERIIITASGGFVPQLDQGTAGSGDIGASAGSSKLDHGPAYHHRFRQHVQQGAGTD